MKLEPMKLCIPSQYTQVGSGLDGDWAVSTRLRSESCSVEVELLESQNQDATIDK